MFTDNPTIPAQLEVLLDVVHVMAGRKATDESLRQLIQPRGLKDVGERSAQVKNHLSAAAELGLIRIDESKNVRLKYHVRGQHQPREAIIEAFDRIAMADAQVEKWAGRFYSFLLLVEGDAVIGSEEAARLTQQFMAGLPSHVSRDNPMNQEKFRALMRWYSYAGLGWTDLAGLFVADPTERVRRALVRIWQEDRQWMQLDSWIGSVVCVPSWMAVPCSQRESDRPTAHHIVNAPAGLLPHYGDCTTRT
jgi:hypothetical protein